MLTSALHTGYSISRRESELNEINGLYTFSSHPKALLINKKRQRHPPGIIPISRHDGSSNPYGNIMYDKRVIRGSNFAQHPPTTPAERQEEARRRAAARRRARPKAFRRLGTPPPVDGRRHTDVQTEGRLEEILAQPREANTACQTEYPWEPPVPKPIYVPPKLVMNQETQVMPGELFDFERESQPVVERVVGRALEQALAEVLQEEEVAGLRAQQRRLHELRLAEWAEARRVTERENKLQKEKEIRSREYEVAVVEQRRAEERAAAAALSQAMLEELLPSILEGLAEAGQIPDPVQDEVQTTVLVPWLVEEVAQEMRQMMTSKHVLTDIVREVLETRAELRKALGDAVENEEEEEDGEQSDETSDEENAAAKSTEEQPPPSPQS